MNLHYYKYSLIGQIIFALSIYTTDSKGEDLGRLFFSAEERATLNAARDAAKRPPPPPATKPKLAVAIPQAAPAPAIEPAEEKPKAPRKSAAPKAVMTGFVERSSGLNTVWLNNQPRQVRGGYQELDPLAVRSYRGR